MKGNEVLASRQIITPICRANRGVDSAINEALARVAKDYSLYAGTPNNAGVTWEVRLVRVDPNATPTTQPSEPAESAARQEAINPQDIAAHLTRCLASIGFAEVPAECVLGMVETLGPLYATPHPSPAQSEGGTGGEP